MAQSDAQRKRAQRERMAAAVDLQPPEEWSEATCLHILCSAQFKGTQHAQAAWRRLGEIHGFVTVTEEAAISRDRHKPDGIEGQR